MNNLESEVRIYSRMHPIKITMAKGSTIFDQKGKRFLDFFCGAGSLNYGHNNDIMKKALIDYIHQDGIVNSLDQLTESKEKFMDSFDKVILQPRHLNYKFQFTGPTGTNAVEAAIKLARKYTQRDKVIYFEDSFHGMTYGSMSISGRSNRYLREEYKTNVVEMPYDDNENSIQLIEEYLNNCSLENIPAAIIIETIQAEGGVKVARKEWLEKITELAKKNNVLLIIDEIQTGCGRTGTFFSFEIADIQPDIICLSKSLSGYGLPFSINLLNPKIDCWAPGEHTGTFRGNNLAFVTGTVAMNWWKNDDFTNEINDKSNIIDDFFSSRDIKLRGRGLIKAIEIKDKTKNVQFQKEIFKKGVLVDTCGEHNFIKIMPPLTISYDELQDGLMKIYKTLN